MQPEHNDPILKPDSLLLYKNHPARLVRAEDRAQQRAQQRLEIALASGETIRVRPKNVDVLHPGPLKSLSELQPVTGEVRAAWEILAGGRTNLAELAELIYGAYTPVTAWAAWQQVAEGVFFEGSPADIRARTEDEVQRRVKERSQAEQHQQARAAFLDFARRSMKSGGLPRAGRDANSTVGGGSDAYVDTPAHRDFLRELEAVALGRSERSPLLRELSRAETPDSAHTLLLELGAWDETVTPYPARLGLPLKQVDLSIPDLPHEDRLDLTHAAAFAIDDADTDTPDDAISLEPLPRGGARLWVHVADAAALVEPDSPLDMEARARGESLHLPEGTVHLLPRELTLKLGMGMNEVSPALSFGIDLDAEGQVTGFQAAPSWVRVTRLTYEAVEERIDQAPFSQITRLAHQIRERRRANGAVMIDFPEVKIDAADGLVRIQPIPTLRSRAMVEEAMILAGIETARFATQNGLPLAFSQQDAPDAPVGNPETLAQMFAARRLMKRSQYKTQPAPHSGLGAAAYAQVTSPLRRYLDLVAHQQIRAYLEGQPLLDESALLERIGAVEAVVGSVRQGEMLSEKHWTLVYLQQYPEWQGEGILVDIRGQYGRGAAATVLIPSLALEARVHLNRDIPLDTVVTLALNEVNLPQRDVRFRVVND